MMRNVSLVESEQPITAPIILPYAPSWVDRLVDGIDQLPASGWWIYPLLWLALYLPLTGISWYDRVYPVGTFNLHQAAICLSLAYYLAMLHYLDKIAGAVLRRLRPVLLVPDDEFERVVYRLTTLPARPALLASLAGLPFAGLMLSLTGDYQQRNQIALTPLTTVVAWIIYPLTWVVGGPLVYHTIRQLRLVHTLATSQTRINLFTHDHIYAFSTLTALTAVGWISINYLWLASASAALENGAVVAMTLGIELIAVVTFIWPLSGMHRLLEREKRQRLHAVALHMEAAIGELERLLASGDLTGIGQRRDVLASLEIEQRTLTTIPTWPWQPDTFRLVLTAICLPVGIYLIQRLLGRVFGL